MSDSTSQASTEAPRLNPLPLSLTLALPSPPLIFTGSAYTELYQQQEAIYLALYGEVAVAKSLLEQLTLVGQGRPWYPSALKCMDNYITNDLRRLDIKPVEQLSGARSSRSSSKAKHSAHTAPQPFSHALFFLALTARPAEDPLESIMYMTSVGVPSIVYETVRDLRQARGERLGACQRKFPFIAIFLLYALAGLEVSAFPLLGAGTAAQAEAPELITVSILELQSLIFASVCGCLVLVLRIIQELWQASGGVFNVDDVLQQMVVGLEEELTLRQRANPMREF